jgi:hypothetical protein
MRETLYHQGVNRERNNFVFRICERERLISTVPRICADAPVKAPETLELGA